MAGAEPPAQPPQNWFIQFEYCGGKNSAVNAVPVDETAFAQRSSLFIIQVRSGPKSSNLLCCSNPRMNKFYASSSNYAPPYPSEGFTLLDNMVDSIVNNNPSDWDYGAYANYIDDRLSSSKWKYLYYKNHFERLRQIKRAYDPQSVFASPQPIT
ncbi:hypothetical protein H4Q26_016820 [Puccinia striiformis f. sp. tritici PST-130]|nr:hypothetical protein H4Q26_016820 [Puccinia striiformis f. sp. tritici PST-130]